VSLAASYFERLYTGSPDPWGFDSRAYERRKRELTLAALPRRRYDRIFEPGCSFGALTGLLAERAGSLVATDVSPRALAEARRRRLPENVSLRQAAIPHEWPEGSFDLIVFSELGYYLDAADLELFIEHATGSLRDDGQLVAVHWRRPVADYPGTGESVHDALAASTLHPLASYSDEHMLLDVFARGPAGRLIGPEDEDR
jgi:SAM-dependent methyltransferase